MTISFTAVYEQGVLRPKEPLNLREGSEVEVVVVPKEAQEPLSGRALYEAIMKIAALPMEGPGDPFTGRDHDKILYDEQQL